MTVYFHFSLFFLVKSMQVATSLSNFYKCVRHVHVAKHHAPPLSMEINQLSRAVNNNSFPHDFGKMLIFMSLILQITQT